MTTETDHVPAAEPGNSWTGYKEPVHDAPLDPQAAPDELPGPVPRQTEPDPPAAVAEQESGAGPASAAQAAEVLAGPHVGADPLLSAEAENDLLRRWTQIQISFVEDPRRSVQDADALIHEIGDALYASLEERRGDLAAGWQHGQPDTEELRLALREYRSFVGVVLPR